MLDCENFECTDVAVSGRRIALEYRLSRASGDHVDFQETLHTPPSLPAPDAEDPRTRAILGGMHKVFGVSYFKAGAPPLVKLGACHVDEIDFWRDLYTIGMSEFWYVNRIDPFARLRFEAAPAHPAHPATAIPRPEQPTALVLVGGGKDSAVASEIVRHAKVPGDAFSLGSSTWQERSAEAMQRRHHIMGRRLDPQLFELNRRGALNGHIPISACIAFAALLVAHLGGYDAIVAANERSADEANTAWQDLSVNHQWSKSTAFEARFQAWCRRQLGEHPVYFSILRPLGELAIAKAFAALAQYHSAFASCNSNFSQAPGDPTRRWCGRCAKCVFTQLMIAPHLSPAAVADMFGGDFIARQENRQILNALLGVSGIKPLDCVGTYSECRAALWRLGSMGRLPPDLQQLLDATPDFDPKDGAGLWSASLATSPEHRMPEFWAEQVDAFIRDT